MLKSAAVTALLGLAVIGAACSPAADLCARVEQCRSEEDDERSADRDSDEAIAICTANLHGILDALRANEEVVCKDYAAAIEDSYRCIAQLDCDDAVAVKGTSCKDERDRADDICERIAKDNIDCEIGFGSVCTSDDEDEGV